MSATKVARRSVGWRRRATQPPGFEHIDQCGDVARSAPQAVAGLVLQHRPAVQAQDEQDLGAGGGQPALGERGLHQLAEPC